MQGLLITAMVACLLLPLSLSSLYDDGAFPQGEMYHSTSCCSVLGLWATLGNFKGLHWR